jgi:tRNA threonylcarbamoyladenosine biosynthesis protein TsaE
MDKLSFSSVTLNVLDEVARDIIAGLYNRRVVLFYGEMGSGKTTLIKEMCRQLGVTGSMSSPTFALVNEYEAEKGKIYHFDLYRVKNPEECLDIGMEEYLYSGNYCFIEWPEVAKPILPENTMKVFMEGSGSTRSVNAE